MGEIWKSEYPVDYYINGDTIDSAWQKNISEVKRIYSLLDRVRSNDETTGEPDDTVPWQWHVDHAKKTLYLRNVADTAWIPICTLNTAGDRFIFDQAVANNGGLPSVQYGLIASRPAEEVDGAVYVATDEKKRYRWNATTKAWDYIDTLITRQSDGKIHVEEADHATKADHAEAATNAGYAASTQRAEIATAAERLAVPVDINGIPFDGTRSISIGVAGNSDSDVSAYQQLLWRTAQNEREISNVELALADENIFPDYNNLLIENFKNGSAETDLLTVAVTSIAAGDNSLDVDDLSQLRQGMILTLTDGAQQEYVQIAGLIKNGSIKRVILVSNTANTYASLPALYRTTASIKPDGAEGTGTSRFYKHQSGTIWSGITASTPSTVQLDTSQSNSTSFSLTSSIQFTSDNLITLAPATVTGIALISSGGGSGTWDNYEGSAQ